MSESTKAVVVAVNLDAGCGVIGILVDGVLHLTEEIVELDKILLSSGTGNRQVVLLSERILGRCRAAVNHGRARRLRQVLLRGHGAIRNGDRSMKRHQGATNLSIGGWVDVATLSTAEEVVNHVIGALAIVATTRSSSTVSNVLSTRCVHGRLVEVQAIARRWLRSVVALVLMRIATGATTHLAIVIIVAGSCVATC